MSKYICWYAYQGMETEGHLQLEKPESFEANSKAEAMYKYLCFRSWRERKEPYHKSLTEHLKSEYCEGGWGFVVRKLDDDEYVSGDMPIFLTWYQQYNK